MDSPTGFYESEQGTKWRQRGSSWKFLGFARIGCESVAVFAWRRRKQCAGRKRGQEGAESLRPAKERVLRHYPFRIGTNQLSGLRQIDSHEDDESMRNAEEEKRRTSSSLRCIVTKYHEQKNGKHPFLTSLHTNERPHTKER